MGFQNTGDRLRVKASVVLEERRRVGLEGLIGGLEFIVINTEPQHQHAAVDELLSTTGLEVVDAFADTESRTVVLRTHESADVLITSRVAASPYARFNDYPKARHLPMTRLETFAFACADVARTVAIQRGRGIKFQSDVPVRGEHAQWILSTPSDYTGLSIGLVERSSATRSYRAEESRDLNWRFKKPDRPFLSCVGHLDHAATRVQATQRDAAILEFMNLTNYAFDFAIYVKSLNSITHVARRSADDFAMVFTSGIAAFVDEATSGPTERFIHNYGPRTHHLAWDTKEIDRVFDGLLERGETFLLPLIGSPEEGLKQTFGAMSSHTLLVNEYIHRFGDFDGFFTKSNVTLLTGATGNQ
ncbi:hypothetical protein KKG90_06005 [Candidatus Bipolaricaulota bacterium]|nr:hypothetical protein [Candidatus Bipolaricaulota bacterium]